MNIVYNRFLKKALNGSLSLTGPNAPKFKIALLNNGYRGSVTDESDFSYIQNCGFEAKANIGTKPTGYTIGGKDISFAVQSVEGDYIHYSSSPAQIKWRDDNFIDYADLSVRSAVVYVSDTSCEFNGMLVTWYDFNSIQELTGNKSITLSWSKAISIYINSETMSTPETSVIVDSELSSTSSNPVQNKVITELIKKLGILVSSETVQDASDVIAEATETELAQDLDRISTLDTSKIKDIFK